PGTWGSPQTSARRAPRAASTMSRFASTAAGSSPEERPRFRAAYGPVLTPPARVVKPCVAVKAPRVRNGTAAASPATSVVPFRDLEVGAARQPLGDLVHGPAHGGRDDGVAERLEPDDHLVGLPLLRSEERRVGKGRTL